MVFDGIQEQSTSRWDSVSVLTEEATLLSTERPTTTTTAKYEKKWLSKKRILHLVTRIATVALLCKPRNIRSHCWLANYRLSFKSSFTSLFLWNSQNKVDKESLHHSIIQSRINSFVIVNSMQNSVEVCTWFFSTFRVCYGNDSVGENAMTFQLKNVQTNEYPHFDTVWPPLWKILCFRNW